ncbi:MULTISPECIES: AzlD domain-containing protein [unclassified Pseudomonas]|uniref:AzlD domain-containing protein n=1 Tax=unclassified Pseudomonas TaxID=196821 RepID=UPI0030D9960C
MIFAVIVGMGLIVFLNRYVFLEPRLPFKLGPGTRDFLGFAVPGMLTAICGPIIFLPGHTLGLSISNPYLLGGLCAVGLMVLTRNVLTSVLLSMGCFYFFRWWP